MLCMDPGAPENAIGALGIGRKACPCMVVGARVPGGKLGPGMSRGAATLVQGATHLWSQEMTPAHMITM